MDAARSAAGTRAASLRVPDFRDRPAGRNSTPPRTSRRSSMFCAIMRWPKAASAAFMSEPPKIWAEAGGTRRADASFMTYVREGKRPAGRFFRERATDARTDQDQPCSFATDMNSPSTALSRRLWSACSIRIRNTTLAFATRAPSRPPVDRDAELRRLLRQQGPAFRRAGRRSDISRDFVIEDSGQPDGFEQHAQEVRWSSCRARRWSICLAAAIAKPTSSATSPGDCSARRRAAGAGPRRSAISSAGI